MYPLFVLSLMHCQPLLIVSMTTEFVYRKTDYVQVYHLYGPTIAVAYVQVVENKRHCYVTSSERFTWHVITWPQWIQTYCHNLLIYDWSNAVCWYQDVCCWCREESESDALLKARVVQYSGLVGYSANTYLHLMQCRWPKASDAMPMA